MILFLQVDILSVTDTIQQFILIYEALPRNRVHLLWIEGLHATLIWVWTDSRVFLMGWQETERLFFNNKVLIRSLGHRSGQTWVWNELHFHNIFIRQLIITFILIRGKNLSANLHYIQVLLCNDSWQHTFELQVSFSLGSWLVSLRLVILSHLSGSSIKWGNTNADGTRLRNHRLSNYRTSVASP